MNKQQLLNELKNEGFSEKILNAFEKIKREDFVPKDLKKFAYENNPLPIAKGATISQPYTIAFMLDLLELDKISINDNYNFKQLANADKSKQVNQKFESSESNQLDTNKTNSKPEILEIGSGSGYVLALINEILKNKNPEIYGIEIIKELAEESKKILKKYKNIKIIHGNSIKALKENINFDRILVSASAEKTPEYLFPYLKNNGILVIPVRNSIFQIKKQNNKIIKKECPGFVFVPLIE